MNIKQEMNNNITQGRNMEKRVRKISRDHRMHKQMVVISNDDAQLSGWLQRDAINIE